MRALRIPVAATITTSVLVGATAGATSAAIAGAVGFGIRAVGKRGWSNTAILEGAFAFGVVLGFVALVFYEMFWH